MAFSLLILPPPPGHARCYVRVCVKVASQQTLSGSLVLIDLLAGNTLQQHLVKQTKLMSQHDLIISYSEILITFQPSALFGEQQPTNYSTYSKDRHQAMKTVYPTLRNSTEASKGQHTTSIAGSRCFNFLFQKSCNIITFTP